MKLVISNLTKEYKKQKVLDNAAFELNSGDIVALVGVNGCGKSTLLNILSGISKDYKGSIVLENDGEKTNLNQIENIISYVPQNSFLLEDLSAYDNLLFWYQGDKKRLKESIDNGLIKDLGIDKYIKNKISKLSVGMRKRVEIACAMAGNPKILLLDEVNASLDIVLKLEIQKLIKDYASLGNIVIMATHEEGDLSICSRICHLENGKLLEVKNTSLKDIFKDKF